MAPHNRGDETSVSKFIERLLDEQREKSRSAFDCASCGLSANLIQEVIDEIEQLTKIAKAADLVSSMSSYDEDADEVSPCHMVYFEELEAALIEWRGSTATGPHRAETTKGKDEPPLVGAMKTMTRAELAEIYPLPEKGNTRD